MWILENLILLNYYICLLPHIFIVVLSNIDFVSLKELKSVEI